MNENEFDDIFEKELMNNNIEINKEKYEIFFNYMNDILEWNKKINVTAIVDPKMFIVKHFVDSLTVCKYVCDGESVIDIGTGAGFPGIPIKIVNEKSKITLIDSVNKKINVITEITNKLNIDNVEIIHTRAEDLAVKKEYREKYDIAITRAVSSLVTIVEYMLPFVKLGGKAICMKGPNIENEILESKKAIEILGGEIVKIDKLKVDDEIDRNIIVIKKIKNTPQKYPRNQGKALKEPIR